MENCSCDKIKKKNMGAFYTPEPYAVKASELLYEAVSRVPEGNDYVIIDRCAGTGNLEKPLPPELLSHFILSTLDFNEHQELVKLFGGKVRLILPPSDALSLEFINISGIIQYLAADDCSIILYENPPFAETTSLEHQKLSQGKASSRWKESYAVKEMKKELKGPVSNELCNVFIWSAFKYYLRQDTDSYIVFAPAKYWKAQHLIDKKFIRGFAFNRRHFNTRVDACIMAALWSNEDSPCERIELEAWDMDDLCSGKKPDILELKKIHSMYSAVYYDKRPFPDASWDGVLLRLSGLEDTPGLKRRIKPLYSKDMLGYLVADSVGFDNPDSKSSLLSAGRYNGNGFFLHRDNYLQKLPLYAASRYACFNRSWTERSRIMKSADGAERYMKDLRAGKLRQWLLRCLLFCCMDVQNHMLSFYGSDGRYYRNELCLDYSCGETLAIRDLKALRLNDMDKALISRFQRLLSEARDCPGYDENLTYGVYQIHLQLDTSHRLNNGRLIYDNSELHREFLDLRSLLKEYYLSQIVPELFKYEFLK